jgi:HEPN domain-containing protein
MKDLKAAKELAARAMVDLRALEELVDNSRVADEIFGFLAQQAAEKALKAGLALSGKKYPVTHDLNRLFQELKRAGVRIPGGEDLISLNPFAVQFRYETMDSSEPELDRPGILRKVESLVGKIQSLMDGAQESGPGVAESPALYRTAGTRRVIRKKKAKA